MKGLIMGKSRGISQVRSYDSMLSFLFGLTTLSDIQDELYNSSMIHAHFHFLQNTMQEHSEKSKITTGIVPQKIDPLAFYIKYEQEKRTEEYYTNQRSLLQEGILKETKRLKKAGKKGGEAEKISSYLATLFKIVRVLSLSLFDDCYPVELQVNKQIPKNMN
jgi:hypothetical protein